MYVVSYQQSDGSVRVDFTNDLANYGMGITPEIVAQVDALGHYEVETLVILKQGIWKGENT